MANKFDGSIEQLKEIIKGTNYNGAWTENKTNGSWKFKAKKGEILTFYKNGTVQFQGQNQENFKSTILPLLDSDIDTPPVLPKPQSTDKKIFIVHGHDKTARDGLELFMHRLGLDVFVLQNNSSNGQTIIEALETNIYEKSSLGIILMTPDDMGYCKTDGETEKKARARQNVILEMGMVMASLGRKNTIIVKKGNLEMPSDTAGLLYLEYNEEIKEVGTKIVQRLQKAGFNLTTEQIASACQ